MSPGVVLCSVLWISSSAAGKFVSEHNVQRCRIKLDPNHLWRIHSEGVSLEKKV
eukprot:TRINITY_DN5895_c0_g2_i1.p2 TRINITY_DN5895_c0_g2~~TRINITY_DN5895_c0_g2_i1.p2  ORF type:complete len:54 (+),score=10.39 TRINITY_DN5895_c0_g2_i1:646-807(+)